MSDKHQTTNAWAESVTGQVDGVCDRFEAAWKGGSQPQLEDFLLGLSEPAATQAFRELLEVELAYRRRSGESPTAEEYRARFPLQAAAIAEAFTPAPAQPRRLGDYEILEIIGSGGMGVVYKARHVRLGRVVALKVLPERLLSNSQLLARFRKEMQSIGRLNHANIVHAYDAREENGVHILVMELIDGVSLDKLVKPGPLSVADACELARQAALGLQHAHEHQLVHRDIKPSNLIFNTSGVAQIVDFGLARINDELATGGLTESHSAMGTFDYMSPEQFDDSAHADIRADIYSLGCTLFNLLAGNPPYPAPQYSTLTAKMRGHCLSPVPRLHALRPQVPAPLAAIVERMMAKQPADRFATPADVAKALAPFAVGSELPKLLAASRAAEASRPTAHSTDHATTCPHVLSGLSDTLATAGRGGRKRANRVKLFCIAGVAAVLILAIIVFIKNKDGKVVATIEVPAGGSVTIQDTAKTGTSGGTTATAGANTLRPGPGTGPTELFTRLTSGDWEWTPPENLGPNVNWEWEDNAPTVSADELRVVFGRLDGQVNSLYESKRDRIDQPFEQATRINLANPTHWMAEPCLSPDALSLYFTRGAGPDRSDIFVTRRKNRDSPWEKPVALGPQVNDGKHSSAPAISPDGCTLIFESDRPGGHGMGDLWICHRQTPDSPFDEAANLGPDINTEQHEANSQICSDGRTVIFERLSSFDWTTAKTAIVAAYPSGQGWTTQAIDPPKFNNSPLRVDQPELSADGHTLYFHSALPNGRGWNDIWLTHRVRKQGPALPASGTSPGKNSTAPSTGEAATDWLDLLPLIDPKFDGPTWIRTGTGAAQLESTVSDTYGTDVPSALSLPITTTGAYRLRVVGTLTGLGPPGSHPFIDFVAGTSRGGLALHAFGQNFAGLSVNPFGPESAENPTHTPFTLERGRQYQIDLRVEPDGERIAITAQIDGQLLFRWSGLQSALGKLRSDAKRNFLIGSEGGADWRLQEVKVAPLAGGTVSLLREPPAGILLPKWVKVDVRSPAAQPNEAAGPQPDKDGFYSLFDGKSLDGWKVGANADSWTVQDDVLVTQGRGPSHLFYVGPVHNHDFRSFHFKAQVMTFPHANSGIYFHTKYQEQDLPDQGLEAQVNATHKDWRKTGSLYDVLNVRDPHHVDNKWFLYEIIVKDKHVELKIDGQSVCDWTQPTDFEPPADHPGRFLQHGTFALQCFDDAGSKIYFKDISVKPLDDPPPARPDAVDLLSVDRHAAEWVVSLGGKCDVVTDPKNHDPQRLSGIDKLADLPEGQLILRAVDLSSCKVSDADLEHLRGLPSLDTLNLSRTPISGAALKAIADDVNLTQLDLTECKSLDAAALQPLSGLTKLTWLSLRDTGLPDAALAHLSDLTQLRHLDLYATATTDAGLIYLEKLTSLDFLHLTNTQVNGDGFSHLEKLTSLCTFFSNGHVTSDLSIQHLRNLKRMHTLWINDAQISDDTLRWIAELPQLGELNVDGRQLTDAGLKALAKAKGLTLLHIHNLQNLTPEGATVFKDLQSLRDLSFGGGRLQDAELATIVKQGKFRALSLEGTLVTDAGLAHLRELPLLEGLGLDPAQLTDQGVKNLGDLPNLTGLRLRGDKVTDAAFQRDWLKQLPHLKRLIVYETQVSDACLARLQKQYPNLKISRH